MALLQMPKQENAFNQRFAAIGEDLKDTRNFNSCYY